MLKSRFLKYDEKQNQWFEVSAMAARDKIGHSLRFANRAHRRQKNMSRKRSNSTSSAETTTTNASLSICSSDTKSPRHECKKWGSLMDHLQSSPLPAPKYFLHKPSMPKVTTVMRETAIHPLPLSSNSMIREVYSMMASDSDIGEPRQRSLSCYGWEKHAPRKNDDMLAVLSDPLGEWENVKLFDFSSQ